MILIANIRFHNSHIFRIYRSEILHDTFRARPIRVNGYASDKRIAVYVALWQRRFSFTNRHFVRLPAFLRLCLSSPRLPISISLRLSFRARLFTRRFPFYYALLRTLAAAFPLLRSPYDGKQKKQGDREHRALQRTCGEREREWERQRDRKGQREIARVVHGNACGSQPRHSK